MAINVQDSVMPPKDMHTGQVIELGPQPDYSMRNTIEQMKEDRALVKSAMKDMMVKDVHYGPAFPGSDKDTLLQPGADLLNSLFRLRPEYEIVQTDHESDFIYYQVRCRLFHIQSGNLVGEGWGSCSSWEKKYRYRSESTGTKVPKKYWEAKDPKVLEEASEMSGRLVARKVWLNGKQEWVIFHEVINEDIYEQDNTILKIACKRAKAFATVQATAASDVFTPEGEGSGDDAPKERKTYRKPAEKKSQGGDVPGVPAHVRAMFKAATSAGITNEEVKDFVNLAIGVEHSKDLTPDQVNAVIDWTKNPCSAEEWLTNHGGREPGQEG